MNQLCPLRPVYKGKNVVNLAIDKETFNLDLFIYLHATSKVCRKLLEWSKESKPL